MKGLRATKMNGKTEFLKRFILSFSSWSFALKTTSLKIEVNYFFCSAANGVFTRTLSKFYVDGLVVWI